MAALVDDSRIVKPLLASLYILATQKIAVLLFNDFDIKTLKKAFSDIQLSKSTTSNECSEEDSDINYNRAKESLLLLPGRLRKDVVRAVFGLDWAVKTWSYEHPQMFIYKDRECFFHWRSDGTIDTIKIAQQLVLDQKIILRERFKIACKYCLMGSIKTLWREMGSPSKSFKTANSVVLFWVRWLSDGSRVLCKQAAEEYLDIPVRPHLITFKRFSAFFPSLRPEDRQKFLIPLQGATSDDLRLCLYTMTQEEQEKISKGCLKNVLLSHLDWPLHRLFPEMAEKMINFFDALSFYVLLEHILSLDLTSELFIYSELLRDLWNMSPEHLKKYARRDKRLMKKVNEFGFKSN